MRTVWLLSWWMIRYFRYGIAEENLFIDPPSITPSESYVTLEVGANYNITCTSEHAITWKPFKEFTGTFHVSYVEMPEVGYRSTIHLFNITQAYVGYFFCVANHTESHYDYSINFLLQHRYTGDTSGVNEIYLYVSDIFNDLAHRDRAETTIFENEYLIVPCKPTFPAVHVTLFEDSHQVDYVEYDKTIGFVIKFSDASDIHGKVFKCLSTPSLDSSGPPILFNVTYYAPKIQSATGLYGTKGDQLTLNCSMDIVQGETTALSWILPKNGVISATEENILEHPVSYLRTMWRQIEIADIQIDRDQGCYECRVNDHLKTVGSSISDQVCIEILEKDDNSLDLYPMNGTSKLEISLKRQVALWQVKYKGNPKPSLVWYDNNGEIVKSSDKYEVTITNGYTILKINYLGLEDSGNYTLKAQNSVDSTEKMFELVVKGAPRLSKVRGPDFVVSDEVAEFVCDVTGYPLSTITWTFRVCAVKLMLISPSCAITGRLIEEELIHTSTTTLSAQRSVLKWNATEPGKVECIAVNTEGKIMSDANVKVTDIEIPFRVLMADNNSEAVVVVGDNVTIICEACAYTYVDINWYLNNTLVKSDKDRRVESCRRDYALCKKITWNRINSSESGIYECRSINLEKESRPKTESLVIDVQEPKLPEITKSSYEHNEQRLGVPFQMFCNFAGRPVPKVQWFKDGNVIENDTHITISSDMQFLNIKLLRTEDFGTFECVGNNRLGFAKRLIRLKRTSVTNNPITSPVGIIVTITLLLLFFIPTIYLFARFRRLRLELKAAGLENFEEGDLNRMNPEIALHEQADLLPYNRKFEFPKEQLKLGKQLGAGAFGVVVKGIATGILPYEESTTVAVKMLKKTADNGEIRALVTELKIMVHLGQHLNVVNLLGAITKNIAKREIMVIVEFCHFGNVQNFLAGHRDYFINQITAGVIDPTILTKEQRVSQGISPGCESDTFPSYQNTSSRRGRTDSSNTECSWMSSTSGRGTGSKFNIFDTQKLINSTGYINGSSRIVTTTDLVCWSFQVARGMKYLSSRKVLHGDLAARNILLCVDNVVKICDFGLARSLYKCSQYQKDGETPLPYKWLAIESIRDQVFSTYSDVWSFGIVMWELFSLGSTPYPGMEANAELFAKLLDGYRMSKPRNATQEIYDIMLHCWNFHPESRPLFNTLEDMLEKLLENGVAQHYVDLNDEYVKMNSDNLGQEQTDYLSFMMAPPEELAPPIPQTEVNLMKARKGALAGYLPMKHILHPPFVVSNPNYIASGEQNTVQNREYFSCN